MAAPVNEVDSLQAEAEEWVAVPSEVDSSELLESAEATEVPNKTPVTEPEVSLPSSAHTESAPASVPFSDSGSEDDNLRIADLEASVAPPEDAQPERAPVDDDVPQYRELPEPEWSQTECHMNDIRYAEKASATVPHRVVSKQLKVLVTGQPETGRTTTIKNLFCSIAQSADWAPPDVSGLTLDDFQRNPEAFCTSIHNRPDTDGNLSISYIIQETPGLKADPARCAEVLCGYLRAQHSAFAAQERDLGVTRAGLEDGRVDAVLYFLPTNARMAESDLDTTVINALAHYAPVIPVMCKADCLEEEEVQQRKTEMERLLAEGLGVFTFPEDIVNAITDAMHGLSQSHGSGPGSPTAATPALQRTARAPPGPAFRLPFNVVAGTHADVSVHPYWFVRAYRWAVCEAYRTVNSDLRLLRQLLLEDGFWAVKEAADALYRQEQAAAAAAESTTAAAAPVLCSPVTTSTGAQTAQPVKDEGSDAHGEEIRHAGRGTHFVPTWGSSTETHGTKAAATGVPMVFPFVSTGVRTTTASRGFGSPLRSGCAGSNLYTATSGSLSASPPSPNHLNPLLMASDTTDGCSGPISAGTSALAALEGLHQPPPPLASGPVAAAAAAAPPAAPAVPEEGKDEQEEFDARMYVEATVKDAQRGMDRRNYRLTLRLEGGEKVLCMRIGDTEGSSLSSLLKKSTTSRPTAYDATANLLKALGCKVVRALITECRHTVFYARVIAVNSASGVRVSVDARPSDAINLAMRHNAPMYVHKDVVTQFAK